MKHTERTFLIGMMASMEREEKKRKEKKTSRDITRSIVGFWQTLIMIAKWDTCFDEQDGSPSNHTPIAQWTWNSERDTVPGRTGQASHIISKSKRKNRQTPVPYKYKQHATNLKTLRHTHKKTLHSTTICILSTPALIRTTIPIAKVYSGQRCSVKPRSC